MEKEDEETGGKEKIPYYGSVDPGMSNKFLAKIDWYIVGGLALYWNKEYKRNHLHPRKVAEEFARMGLKRVSANEGTWW